MKTWTTDQLPDSDTTVLMRLDDPEAPVWPGFHDGDCWRYAEANAVEVRVLGWLDIDYAAGMLDILAVCYRDAVLAEAPSESALYRLLDHARRKIAHRAIQERNDALGKELI